MAAEAEHWGGYIILTLMIIPLIFVGVCFFCCLCRLCCSSESKSESPESQLETETPEVQPTTTPTVPANSSLSRAQTIFHRLGRVVRLVERFLWGFNS